MITQEKKMKLSREELIDSIDKIELMDRIASIADIIYMELPLRYQDAWLEDIVNKGIWLPDETEEILREQEQ
tara:strand:- start:14 stop:229 length:216 start_codon:yes stop_codon:yes gene_type:complete